MRDNYAPKPFTKPNVLKDLQDQIDNKTWRKLNLPLTDSLRKQMDDDITLIEQIMDDIRRMT